MSKGPEAQIQSAIMDYLTAVRVLAWRMNSGAMSGEYKGKAWFMRFGTPGMGDILALPTVSGKFKGFPCSWTGVLWIEVKADKGRQSEAQKVFERTVKDAGAHYLLARSVEDVKAWMVSNGVALEGVTR